MCNSSPQILASVITGVIYLTPGGRNGIGAPSSATAIVGTITAVYVQNRPTIRINILNARFMGSFSLCGSPGSGNPKWLEL